MARFYAYYTSLKSILTLKTGNLFIFIAISILYIVKETTIEIKYFNKQQTLSALNLNHFLLYNKVIDQYKSIFEFIINFISVAIL